MIERDKMTCALAIMVLQVTLNIAVLTGLSPAREVVGFVVLSFLPGFLVLRALGFKKNISHAETFLFSAGFSITFLMLGGFLTSEIGAAIGISRPLSTTLLMFVGNGAMLCLILLFCRTGRLESKNHGSLQTKSKIAVALLVVPLILSVLGAVFVNVLPYSNNSTLLVMILVFSVLLAVAAMWEGVFSEGTHTWVILALTLSLLFHFSLISAYIHGGDIFAEYHDFDLTKTAAYWNPTMAGKTHAMLSTTILPTIYSAILGLSGEAVFKIILPIVFSLVPLGLYELYRRRHPPRIALLSVLFFVANSVLYTEIVTLARQMIAEFLYVLLFLVIFDDGINRTNKSIAFTLFGFGLIVSHYAISYFFLASIILLWIVSFIRKSKSAVSLSMIAIFLTICFAWYIYVSGSSTFSSLLDFADNIYRNMVTDFFNPESRGGQVLQGIGVGGIETLWHLVGRYLFYAVEGLILIGFVTTIVERKKNLFTDEYSLLVSFNMMLILMAIVLPNFATSFNMTRLFHVALFFISPLCFLGVTSVLRLLLKRKYAQQISFIVMLAVVVPFFLFQTGFIYEITNDVSWSLPLSRYRLDPDALYVSLGVLKDTQYHGTRWLSGFMPPNDSAVFSDWTIQRSILAYGNRTHFHTLGNITTVPTDSLVFLNEFNLDHGQIYGPISRYNLSEVTPRLDKFNLVYSNGGCEIYVNAGKER